MSSDSEREDLFAEVQNVVASVDLRCKIKLEKAASRLPGDVQVSYIPEQFPGVVVKIKKPKVSILVFSSGKLVVTGAKSVPMIEEAVEVISELLRQAGHNVKHEATITVQNIVASGTLGKRINLELVWSPGVNSGGAFRTYDLPVLVLHDLSASSRKSFYDKEDRVFRVDSLYRIGISPELIQICYINSAPISCFAIRRIPYGRSNAVNRNGYCSYVAFSHEASFANLSYSAFIVGSRSCFRLLFNSMFSLSDIICFSFLSTSLETGI